MNKMIAIDCETTGLNPWKDELLGLSIYDGVDATYYRWGGKDAIFPWPWELLADPSITKLGHNIRFDVKFLTVKGIPVQGPWEDTKLLAQLINENRKLGLKPLTRSLLGTGFLLAHDTLQHHLKELKLTMADLGNPWVDQTLVSRYCNEDTVNTWELYQVLQKKLSTSLEDYYYKEMLPLEKVLMDIEIRGNHIDLEKLDLADKELTSLVDKIGRELNELLHDEIEKVRAVLYTRAKEKYKTEIKRASVERPVFNWNSAEQKRMLFYDYLGLGEHCTATTETGKPALDRKTLASLKLPSGKLKKAIDLQVELQSYSKMHSAYVVGLQSRIIDGVIHGEYYQASGEEWKRFEDDSGGTVTGRLSHRNPNLGNLPRRTADYWRGAFAKDLFVPRRGHVFIYADYSQIELRVAAHLSQDKAFLHAFNKGLDPHQQTAEELGITRQQAKTVNFLLIYYGSAWRLAHELGMNPHNKTQLRQAEAIRNNFFTAHPELQGWINEIHNTVMSTGMVTSMFGRVRRLPDIWSRDESKQRHALKQAGNFVVQSAAASICKRAMIALSKREYRIVNQVHDSITCMVYNDEGTPLAECALQEMQSIMNNVVELSVPLETDGKILETFKE